MKSIFRKYICHDYFIILLGAVTIATMVYVFFFNGFTDNAHFVAWNLLVVAELILIGFLTQQNEKQTKEKHRQLNIPGRFTRNS